MKRVWIVGVAGLVLLVSGASPSRAMVALSGGGSEFRVKSLRVKSRLSRGLAETVCVWTFADEARRWKPEVEFTFDAPPRGVVTFFAYWFNGERVVARVVEKARARAIYDTLTSWNTDPALIESDGRNRFRAKIFPVFAGQDVRIEMHMVQPLDTDAAGWKWGFPLRVDRVQKRPLAPSLPSMMPPGAQSHGYEKLSIEVDARGLGERSGHSSSLPLSGRGGVWRYEGKKVSGLADFSLWVARPRREVQADLNAARAAGREGYFAMSLALPPRVKRASLRIEGVPVRDMFPREFKADGNRGVLVCGKYLRAGRGTLVVRDKATGEVLRRPLLFSGARGANNGSAKLWAAHAIAALGAGEANRARVMELSKRWTLPSPHTAWLAVPKSERVNLDRTRAQADLRSLSREVAGDILLKRSGRSAQSRRARFEQQGGNEAMVTQSLNALAEDVARAHETERLAPRPDTHRLRTLRQQLDGVLRVANAKVESAQRQQPEQVLAQQRGVIVGRLSQDLGPRYAESLLYEGEGAPRTRALKAQIDRLKPEANSDSYYSNPLGAAQHAIYLEARQTLHRLAYEIEKEKRRLEPRAARVAALEGDFKRLLSLSGRTERPDSNGYYSFREMQRPMAQRDATREMLQSYRDEAARAAPDEARLRRIYARLEELLEPQALQRSARPYSYYTRETQGEDWAREAGIDRLPKVPQVQAAPAPQKQTLLAQIDKQGKLFARPGDPLIRVSAPPDARKVIAILPGGTIKTLLFNAASGCWEARFDIPTYARDGSYTITILIVARDGARQRLGLDFAVDTRAGALRAQAQRPAPGEAASGSGRWKLSLRADERLDRAIALAPWGERIELRREEDAQRLSAQVEVPQEWRERAFQMRIVATDRAHNRSELWLDMAR